MSDADANADVIDTWLIVQSGLRPPHRVANGHAYEVPRYHACLLWCVSFADAIAEPSLPDSRRDVIMQAAWTGCKALLQQRLPGAEWLLMPKIKNEYLLTDWNAFLRDHANAPISPAG